MNNSKRIRDQILECKPRQRRGQLACTSQIGLIGGTIPVFQILGISKGSNTRTGRTFRKKLSRKLRRQGKVEFAKLVAEELNPILPDPLLSELEYTTYMESIYEDLNRYEDDLDMIYDDLEDEPTDPLDALMVADDIMNFGGDDHRDNYDIMEARLDFAAECIRNPHDLATVGPDNRMESYHTDAIAGRWEGGHLIMADEGFMEFPRKVRLADEFPKIDLSELPTNHMLDDSDEITCEVQTVLPSISGSGLHSVQITKTGNMRAVKNNPKDFPRMVLEEAA